jgi:hypothetical protein
VHREFMFAGPEAIELQDAVCMGRSTEGDLVVRTDSALCHSIN